MPGPSILNVRSSTRLAVASVQAASSSMASSNRGRIRKPFRSIIARGNHIARSKLRHLVASHQEAQRPVAAGAARIWFYRDYEPSVSLNLANVALNGASAGYVQPDGSPLYRDVSPGHYRITVESPGTDVNQSKDVDLAPGQEAFVKILALDSWESGGEQSQYKRDTFYVSLVSSQVARAELGRARPGG